MAARVDGGERADGDEPREVGDDHQPPPREPVGERPADQERGEDADRLADEDDAELRRPASVNVFQPSAVRKAASPISEIVWPVKRKPEVAVAQRVERARTLSRPAVAATL